MYGDKVSIEYFDMAVGNQARPTELLAKVPGNRQFFPMVFVNDELKAVGSAEYHQILYLVREALQH